MFLCVENVGYNKQQDRTVKNMEFAEEKTNLHSKLCKYVTGDNVIISCRGTPLTMNAQNFYRFIGYNSVCEYIGDMRMNGFLLEIDISFEDMHQICNVLKGYPIIKKLDSKFYNIFSALGIGHKWLFEEKDGVSFCYINSMVTTAGEKVSATW